LNFKKETRSRLDELTNALKVIEAVAKNSDVA